MMSDDRYESIRLEKLEMISRIRPENNERKLFLSLTEKGEAMKEKALGSMHST